MVAKVAIAGLGNCAAVFLQGLDFYSKNDTKGLWHPEVAGLSPREISIVAAFDIDSRKVGKQISEAAFASPNVAKRYHTIRQGHVRVAPGVSRGELPPHLRGMRIQKTDSARVCKTLEESGAEIFVNLVSSGSDVSSTEYAKVALQAGCAFVNCTPTLIANNNRLMATFQKAKVPLIGDDLMSQFGGTAFHKGLLGLMVRRGIKISKSYQLDVGGGSETLNTIDETIKMAKRRLKTTSVASEVPYSFETVAGTTDYVDYMGNERTSYFWFEASGFMNSGLSIDVYMRSSDGANAGNILLDVIRATHGVMKSGKPNKTNEVCAYGFKSPPKPMRLDEALTRFSDLYIN